MQLLSKFNFLAGIKTWLIAFIAVLGVVVKLLWNRGERLEKKLERANEKVKAHEKFRENRRKVKAMSFDDKLDAANRMFPPSHNRPDPPS